MGSMMRTSQPAPYRATTYDLHINTKADPPTLHVMRTAIERRQVKSQYRIGWENEERWIGKRWEPILLSDFLDNPFEVVPVEHSFQREEILAWLHKEGYEPQAIQ